MSSFRVLSAVIALALGAFGATLLNASAHGAPKATKACSSNFDCKSPLKCRKLKCVVVECDSDAACNDGFFCNGAEQCQNYQCVPGTPPCKAGDICSNDTSTCKAPCPDSDNDGHQAASCGGDDCDDKDKYRYPGAVEVCDAQNRDEDCDPTTFGFRDDDRDGVGDARCCNGTVCGADCDDGNPAIVPASQVCDGAGVGLCRDGKFELTACSSGTVCIPQPNGTGVCSTAPGGYSTPPAAKRSRPSKLGSSRSEAAKARAKAAKKTKKTKKTKSGSK